MRPYFETKLGKLYHGNCEDVLPYLPDVDLTITSPPYDDLRNYKGYIFNFQIIAGRLLDITKDGGVVVWVVNDTTIEGSETCTSFKQALYFKKIGFNLHDTMIYQKMYPVPRPSNRYEQSFEYMFVFSKGKIKTINLIRETAQCQRANRKRSFRNKDGSFSQNTSPSRSTKIKTNIWEFITGHNRSKHPAVFPKELAHDHIISWSNKKDIILDPMCGSGTTLEMAEKLNRKWIGIEISEEYCEMAANRIDGLKFGLEQVKKRKRKEGLLY